MSLSNVETAWHNVYENATETEREAIDAAYTAARGALSNVCMPANDDRAEQLIAAITRYLIESSR